MHVTIYHNPRCSKSRTALETLRANGIEPKVVEYLQNPPSHEELAAILEKLGLFAHDIIRTKEPEYIELGLLTARYTEEGLIDVMREHPKLMERPIIVVGDKAFIARSEETLKAAVAAAKKQ